MTNRILSESLVRARDESVVLLHTFLLLFFELDPFLGNQLVF